MTGPMDANSRAGHRKSRRAEIQEWVTEGIHAIAIDVCHRARRAYVEVAVNQAETDGIARAKWSVRRSGRRRA